MNTINGLDRQLSRIEVVMETARIVKRNQHLRSLGPDQVYSSRRKEVSMFTVLRWFAVIGADNLAACREKLMHWLHVEVLSEVDDGGRVCVVVQWNIAGPHASDFV
jgi:hypothetical protein